MQEMDEYVQERGRLLELKLAKLGVANEEEKDMHPNEHKQDEHPKKDYNCKPINSFFMPKRVTENRDVREKELNMTIRNEIQHNKLSREEKAITTAMKRLISKCREQLLVVWKSPTHQLDDNINRLGYEHSYIIRLICSKGYMNPRISTAVELAALLRRCSYPKRDVIRWI